MRERRILWRDNTDIDTVRAAFEHALVEHLPRLEIPPDVLDIGVGEVPGLAFGRGRRRRGSAGALCAGSSDPQRQRECTHSTCTHVFLPNGCIFEAQIWRANVDEDRHYSFAVAAMKLRHRAVAL